MKRNRVGLVWVLAFCCLVPGAVLAQDSAVETQTVDFEAFATGEVVSAIPHGTSGKFIRVRGINPGFAQNAAVIFDSDRPGRHDLDLGSPNHTFEIVSQDGKTVPGPGMGEGGLKGNPCENDRRLGKILIVDDDLSPAIDGRVEVPDDEGQAGAKLTLDFSEIGPVRIHGLAVIDVEEPDAEVFFYNVGIEERQRRARKRQIEAFYRVHTEDNGVARLFDPDLRNVPESGCHVTLIKRKRGVPLEPVENVMAIETDFSGSGAIARIIYSVQPPEGDRRKGKKPKSEEG